MSKKNNLKTRKNAHDYALQREKDLEQKRVAKQERKKQARESKMSVDGGTKKTKKKTKGIRLKKNVVFRGIKIKDAASKQKVKEMIKEQVGMDIDDS